NEKCNFGVSLVKLSAQRQRDSSPRANSYGARRTWRQTAGRSAIRGPGLGFDGGDGLGWSTASVNQYASSLPQPSSAGRGGCGVHFALSEGQPSPTAECKSSPHPCPALPSQPPSPPAPRHQAFFIAPFHH